MPARDELEVRNRGHVIALTRAVAVFFGALALVALTITAYNSYTNGQILHAVRSTQQQNSPLVEQVANGNQRIADLANQIASCTTPGQACYERGQKATGDAVASINQITLYAVACSRQPELDTYEEIRDCVMTQLSAHPH